jgi:hypothetical protein
MNIKDLKYVLYGMNGCLIITIWRLLEMKEQYSDEIFDEIVKQMTEEIDREILMEIYKEISADLIADKTTGIRI